MNSPTAAWLTRSAARYPNTSSLVFAAATFRAARSPRCTAAQLHGELTIVAPGAAPSIQQVRAAVAVVSSKKTYPPVHSSALAVGRRWLVFSSVFASAVSPLSSVGRRSLALVRRAAVVIGLHHAAECESFARVIVSARWLALQLGCTVSQAGVIIHDLEACGVLRNPKLLRDHRTRAFRYRSPYGASRFVRLVFADDIANLVRGVTPEPGTMGDVLLAAGSPVWGLADDLPHRGGVYSTLLADTAQPLVRAWRAAVADPLPGVPVRDGWSDTLRQAATDMLAALQPASMGGAQAGRQATSRGWLAGRPADESVADWLAGVASLAGLDVVAGRRMAEAATERRARRKAADQATGGRRVWRTPEEFTRELLSRVGARPTTLAEAKPWLLALAEAWASVGARATIAQTAAVTVGTERVLVTAGMPPVAAHTAAARLTGGGVV